RRIRRQKVENLRAIALRAESTRLRSGGREKISREKEASDKVTLTRLRYHVDPAAENHDDAPVAIDVRWIVEVRAVRRKSDVIKLLRDGVENRLCEKGARRTIEGIDGE